MSHALDFEGQSLVGVSSVLYDDLDRQAVRFGLALQTAQAYADSDHPLIVVDASPIAEVGVALSERGAIVLPARQPGLATQYMEGVAAAVAAGAERVVRHEPEKTRMIDFAPQIVNALINVDLLVIGRTEQAMASLPTTQARTERIAGWLLEEHLQFPPDALSGGRGFTAKGAEYLAKYDVEEHGNNWLHLHYPVLAAMRDGVRVGGIQVNLAHPLEMLCEEEGDPGFDAKRYEQFFMQMESLLAITGYSPQNPEQ